jgi:hypothetical protein
MQEERQTTNQKKEPNTKKKPHKTKDPQKEEPDDNTVSLLRVLSRRKKSYALTEDGEVALLQHRT